MSNTKFYPNTDRTTQPGPSNDETSKTGAAKEEHFADPSYTSMELAVTEIAHPCTFLSIKKFYGLQ